MILFEKKILINFFLLAILKYSQLNATTTINDTDLVIINDENIKNPNRINVAITFSKAKDSINLQDKFKTCISSLLKHAKIDINFFIIGDNESQKLAKGFFAEIKDVKIKYDVSCCFSSSFNSSFKIFFIGSIT
jgi:hypothetical protein